MHSWPGAQGCTPSHRGVPPGALVTASVRSTSVQATNANSTAPSDIDAMSGGFETQIVVDDERDLLNHHQIVADGSLKATWSDDIKIFQN